VLAQGFTSTPSQDRSIMAGRACLPHQPHPSAFGRRGWTCSSPRGANPLIYLVTWEEQRVDALLASLAESHGKALYRGRPDHARRHRAPARMARTRTRPASKARARTTGQIGNRLARSPAKHGRRDPRPLPPARGPRSDAPDEPGHTATSDRFDAVLAPGGNRRASRSFQRVQAPTEEALGHLRRCRGFSKAVLATIAPL